MIYTGSSPEACFLEVLAVFRADPGLAPDLAAIKSSPEDEDYATVEPGVVERGWCGRRLLGVGELLGEYVDVAHSQTIAALRPVFIQQAMHFGLADFDAAAIKSAEPRALTRAVSRYLYGVLLPSGSQAAGIFHRSRHGDEHELWAVFERSGSGNIVNTWDEPIPEDHPALLAALSTHHLVLA